MPKDTKRPLNVTVKPLNLIPAMLFTTLTGTYSFFGLLRLSSLYRAAAYTILGRDEDAVSDCKRAIEIDPSYSKAYTRLG
jgi:hypothetical protein